MERKRDDSRVRSSGNRTTAGVEEGCRVIRLNSERGRFI